MILAVHASGRRNSNSSFLLDRALEGGATGRAHRTVELASLTFRGCTGCGGCRAGADGCVLKDDLTPVLGEVARADAVFLSAPVYYGSASGIFKSFLDRWYGFRDGERKLRIPSGRPLLYVMTQGHPDPDAYAEARLHLEKIFQGYGFEAAVLTGAGLEQAGAAARDETLTARARETGRIVLSKLG